MNELYYRISGDGEPILFLHGFVSSSDYWNNIIKQLDDSDFQKLSLDLLGFGESIKPHTRYSAQTHVDSIIAVIKKSGISIPLTIVGHSMGSLLALYLAQSRPDIVKNLLLISPPLYNNKELARNLVNSSIPVHHNASGVLARVSCFMMCHTKPVTKYLTGLFSTESSQQQNKDALKHTWNSYSSTLANVIEDQSYLDFGLLSCPITILYGMSDNLLSSADIEEMKHIAKIIEIEGDHQLPINKPDIIVQLIKRTTSKNTIRKV